MTDHNWGEENPGLTKRYVGRLHRTLDADMDTGREFAAGMGKAMGLIAAPPAVVTLSGIGACNLVHATLPAVSAQFTNLVGWAGFSALTGLEVGAVGVVVLAMAGDPSDEVASRRVRSALRGTRLTGIVASSAAALLAGTLDTGDALHVFHDVAAAHTANSVGAAAAGVTAVAILGNKIYKAVAKPLPAKALSE